MASQSRLFPDRALALKPDGWAGAHPTAKSTGLLSNNISSRLLHIHTAASPVPLRILQGHMLLKVRGMRQHAPLPSRHKEDGAER